ncbi:MFS transporter [Pararobbsia silviterrae]|uniref:MFS transporter n=1 Tax=Pararobbsia silviterrae TaxID=1792498 RepID=UPI001314BC05|nr:MFS transporter [Pararobbsia silviterrae]
MISPAHWHAWLPIAVLLVGAFLPPMDFYVLNVALPEIRRSIHAAPYQLQLSLAGYAGAYAVGLVPSSSLGETYGRKRMFLTGLFCFTLASTLCGAATTPWALIAGRIAQGASAAAMIPQILSLVKTHYTSRVYPVVTSGIGIAYGTAALIGQFVAGGLLAWRPFGWTWQAIFFVNLPVGALAWLAGLFWLPGRRSTQSSSVNVLGSAWLLAAFSGIVIPLAVPSDVLALTSKCVIGALALASMVPFYRYQRARIAAGRSFTVDVRMLDRRSFRICLIVALLFFTDNVFFLVYAVFLQQGLGFTPLAAANTMVAFGLGFVFGPMTAARIAKRAGARTLSISFASLAAGFGLLACSTYAHPERQTVLASLGLMIAGFGHGLTIASLLRITLEHVYRHEASSASGLINTALQLSTAIGTAAFGSIFYASLPMSPVAIDYAHALVRTLIAVVGVQAICIALSLRLDRWARVSR